MRRFNNYNEMYDALRSYHGTDNYKKLTKYLFSLDEKDAFGNWRWDTYQCGNNRFCDEYTHENTVIGKTYVFYFYSDHSDTIKDDKIYNCIDSSFYDSLIFRNSII